MATDSQPRPVTVVAADDHPLFRAALERMCEAPGIELLACATDGESAYRMIVEHEPDLALLDVEMPGLSGPALTARLAEEGLATRVLFLSAHHEGETIYDALARGGHGYIGKDSPPEAIRQAIIAVGRGRRVLGPGIDGALIGRIQALSGRAAPRLSEREALVLRYASQGKTTAEMAQLLNLSPGTVKTHLATLYAKLGASDRAKIGRAHV